MNGAEGERVSQATTLHLKVFHFLKEKFSNGIDMRIRDLFSNG